MVRVPGNGGVDLPLRALELAAEHRVVPLDDLALGELPGERQVRGVVLGHDHQAAGELVEAVDDAGPRHAADPAELTAAVMQQRAHERVVLVARGGMHHHPGRLVQHDQPFVLEHDLQREFASFDGGRLGLGPSEGDGLARLRGVGRLHADPRHAHGALADQALQVDPGDPGKALAEEGIQPHPRSGGLHHDGLEPFRHQVSEGPLGTGFGRRTTRDLPRRRPR